MSDQKLTVSLILNSASFAKQLQDINKQIKLSESDFQKLSSTTTNFGTTMAGAQGKIAALARDMELQSKKTDLYKQAISDSQKELTKLTDKHKDTSDQLTKLNAKYDETVKTMGKGSDEAKALKNEISGLEKQKASLENRIISTNSKITTLNTELNKSETQYNKLSHEVDEASKKLDNFKVEQAAKRLNDLGTHLDKVGDRFEKIGSKISSVGDSLTKYVALPIIGVGAYAGKAAADFEQAMSKVKAVSDASGEEMKTLSDEAIKWGMETKFSAKEAADALGYMGQAGWKTQQMVAGLPGVLALAATDNIALADASSIVTAALNGMGLSADEAGHFADVLAVASAASNVNVTDMGETFKYAAPVAGMLGIKLEDLSVAISLMGNAGIVASQAGTSLRGGLLNLVRPSKAAADAMAQYDIELKKNKDGQIDLAATMVDMRAKLSGLDESSRAAALGAIMGKTAVSGWAAIISASDKDFQSLTGQINNSAGAAEKMAGILQDNVMGKWENFMGSVETLGIKLGNTLLPMITDVLQKVQYWVDKFSALDEGTQKNIIQMALWAVGISIAVKGLGGMITGIGNTVSAIGTLSKFLATTTVATEAAGAAAVAAGGAGGFGTLIAGFGGVVAVATPFILAGAAVAGTIYAIYKVMSEDLTPAVDLFADKITTTADTTSDAYSQMGYNVQTETIKISEATKQAVGSYIDMDKGVRDSLYDMQVNSTVVTEQIKSDLTTKFTDMGNQIKGGIQKDFDDAFGTLKGFFENSTALADSEEAAILQSTTAFYDQKKAAIDEYEKQINEIMKKASEEKRQLTTDEVDTIEKLQNEMREQAIKNLSETEIESKTIMERIKANDKRITAEQASEHIKKAEETRQKAVAAAEGEYNKRIGTIIKMRDESKVISADQADKLIKDAERTKNETVSKAGEMKGQVVDKIRGMNSTIYSDVDSNTGKILTRWDKLKNWWNSWWPSAKNVEVKTSSSLDQYVNSVAPITSSPVMDRSALRTMSRNISTFADNAYIPTVQDVAVNGPSFGVADQSYNQVIDSYIKANSTSKNNQVNETNVLLKEQNSLMMKLISVMLSDRQTVVEIDGRAIASSTDRYQGEIMSLKARDLGLV